jgi:PhzF family phenazine biosynthesis protein
VIPLEEWLPDETMQAIAMENNLAETAFTVPTSGDADYELRWFTPTVEVALCGHATLASGHVLIGDNESICFRTRKAGLLTVRKDSSPAKAGVQPGPRLSPGSSPLKLDLPVTLVKPAAHDALLYALGTPEAELFLSYSGAEATAIILLEDAAAVRACTPDMKALAAIDLMAIITAPGDGEYDVVSRVFVPAWGVDEDPVTGSAHAALAPFWSERLGRDSFTAFQASKRGGLVQCRLTGDRAILGGSCVTVIEGTMRL